MKYVKLILFLFVFALMSCNSEREHDNKSLKQEDLNYAKGFTIEYNEDYQLITVFNPWQGANSIKYQYALVKEGVTTDDFNKNWIIIKTPVKRVICLSTTHIAFLDAINETNSIVGISGLNHVNNKKIRKKIEANEIPDVGYDNSLNYELIASLNPDVVITYGVGSQIASYNQKLNDLGIKTIINAEYLENHPLGKLEWIKFMASLFDKEEVAAQYFGNISQQYNGLLALTDSVNYKPTVLFGLPWKDTWYVPGGDSYLAKMVDHAGGNYIWKDNESRESLPFDIESIFSLASYAKIWLNTGTVNSKTEIIKTDERFEEFKPFISGKIYNNNKIVNDFGGNDYWESGLINPHIVLKDMIKIIHPKLLSNHQFVYYKRIE